MIIDDTTALETTGEPATDASDSPSLITHVGVFLFASGLFTLIARGVATRTAQRIDEPARDFMQEHRSEGLDVAVKPVTALSLPLLVASSTAALAYWLKRNDRPAAALATIVTPLVAAAVGQSFTTFLAQRNPPDAQDSPDGEVTEPSFPSGHTTGVTAEAFAIGYILAREDLLTPAIATALAAWPLLVGVTRVYRDRHWTSDVLGGYSAGTAVAAAMAMLYELRRSRS